MIKQMTIALMLIAPGVLASQVDDSNNSIVEYATRTAKDYCHPSNTECVIEFSSKITAAFKDGQNDVEHRRMKEKTLSKRYEQRLNVTECIPSDKKYKEMCASMVDRLVDSYNRGLNSK
ncbi:valyl-tRNA synthetase modifier [Escherichia phage Bp7]|uniref:Valyl-tRNA synthetase modifier n=2 Tax=Dhakavirus TaxID=1914165 RepID=A0A172Q1T7_9CAUD|nr:valyl tRNA synthetase modifier [Escherichia phage Bp7]YP_009324001.1 valyl tRNA synthetase modifier [Escherichia phage MX01]ASJ79372.1 hypothetical protein SHP1_050 [Salmonella phage SHP1]QAY00137.1 valyl-tRNA synthetase modifier [Escherichia phage EcWhh-1]QPI13386.1 valyl-tRNA synthetase modifier [Salmonella phage vB_SalM_ABTNLsp5]QVW28254.1 valyl-tRNA synthetase modifier [Escherichia phage C6]AEN93743.1 valyl-tRNA synthetase modifier [Escherichia phage Bp7]